MSFTPTVVAALAGNALPLRVAVQLNLGVAVFVANFGAAAGKPTCLWVPATFFVAGGKPLTVYGRTFVHRVARPFGGTLPGYFLDAEGRWWLHNDQRGWVEVPATSRALQAALTDEKAGAL